MEFGRYNVSLLVCVGMLCVVCFIGCRGCFAYGGGRQMGLLCADSPVPSLLTSPSSLALLASLELLSGFARPCGVILNML